ncbi:MAG: twin-arginine translocase TatA/TatE family subunit [Acidobacteriota bacterium]
MFGSIGGPELVVLAILALLIFGPRKLPQLGRSVGKGLAELRRAGNDLRSTLDREIRLEEPPPAGRSTVAESRDEARARATLTEASGGESGPRSISPPPRDE